MLESDISTSKLSFGAWRPAHAPGAEVGGAQRRQKRRQQQLVRQHLKGGRRQHIIVDDRPAVRHMRVCRLDLASASMRAWYRSL